MKFIFLLLIITASHVSVHATPILEQSSENVAGNATQAGRSAVNNFYPGAEEEVNQFTKLINSLQDVIKNQFDRRINRALQRVLNDVNDSGQELQDKFSNLMSNFNEASRKCAYTIEIEKSQLGVVWNQWALDVVDKNMANASTEVKQQGVDLAESLVDEFNVNLKECADGVITKLENLQDSIDVTIRSFEPLVKVLSLQISTCKIEIGSYRAAARCINKIPRKLEAIRKASPKLSSLVEQAMKIAEENFLQNECVVKLLTNIDSEQKFVEEQIREWMAGGGGGGGDEKEGTAGDKVAGGGGDENEGTAGDKVESGAEE